MKSEQKAVADKIEPSEREKKNPFRPEMIAGALIGMAVGNYAGVNVLIPLFVAFFVAWSVKKAKPEFDNDLKHIFAVHSGHIIWFAAAAYTLQFQGELLYEIAIYAGLTLWLMVKRTPLSIKACLIYQTGSVAFNLYALLDAPLYSADSKALVVHCALRLTALWLLYKTLKKLKSESTLSKAFHYFGDHWKGNLPLGISYWINGVLIGALVSGSASIWTASPRTQWDLPISWLFLILGVGFGIWSLTGIWRSANRNIEQSNKEVPKGGVFWPYSAKVMVVIGLAQAIYVYIPATSDLISTTRVYQSAISNQFFIDLQGTTDVVLNGYINNKSVAAIRVAFEDSERTALVFNSPGGFLVDAFELADFVEEKELLVAVKQQCVSGCLLVLAASTNNLISPSATIAFHNPEPIAEFKGQESRDLLTQETQEYFDRFVRYGVPKEFLDEMKKNDTSILGLGDLYTSGIAKLVWITDKNEYFPIEQYCAEIECPTTVHLSAAE